MGACRAGKPVPSELDMLGFICSIVERCHNGHNAAFKQQSAYEMKNNWSLFDRLFKTNNNDIFLFGISFFCLMCPIKTALERLKAARTIITLHDIDFQKKLFSVEDRTNYFRYLVEFSKFEFISVFSNLECKVRQAGEENTNGEKI